MKLGGKKIDPVDLERKIFKVRQSILLFCSYLPLEKSVALYLTNLNLFTQGCFVSSLVEIGPVVLEKKIFKLRQGISTIS